MVVKYDVMGERHITPCPNVMKHFGLIPVGSDLCKGCEYFSLDHRYDKYVVCTFGERAELHVEKPSKSHEEKFEVTVLIRDKINRHEVANIIAKALLDNGYIGTVLSKEGEGE